MRDDEFDDIIRKELDGHQVHIPQMDWARMKSMLDEQSLPDEEFDDIVKSTINSYTSELNTDNWIALRTEILRNKELRTLILRMKVLELAMALFFLIFLSTLFNINNNSHDSQLHYSKKWSERNHSSYIVRNVNPAGKTSIDKNLIKANSEKEEDKSDMDDISAYAYTNLVEDNEGLSASFTFLKSQSAIHSFNDRTNRRQKNDLFKPELSIEPSNKDRNIESLDMLPVEVSLPHSNLRVKNLSNMAEVVALDNESEKSKKKYFVSLSAGPRKNIISSPFDPVYRTSAYSAISTNYEINFKIGISHNRLDYYTGASYILQEYQPKRVKERVDISSSRYVQSLSNNQFKTLSIPLGLNYHLIKRNNFSLYASVASEGNLVLTSNYKVKIDVYNNENRSFTSSKAIKNSLLEGKNFDKGYSNGGNFRDNLYISSSVGLGYTYAFGNSFVFLAEGRYQHTIITSGIGPNEDRFHGASLNIGLTYQF